MDSIKNSEKTKEAVCRAYGAAASSSIQPLAQAGGCDCRTCGPSETAAKREAGVPWIVLSEADLVDRPEDVPSLAQLRPREMVLDLGSAGALPEDDYLDRIRAAGFTDVEVLSRDRIKVSESQPWALARAALAEAGLALDTLDHTIVDAKVRAYKPAVVDAL
jgi:hypothetical protein